VIYLDYNATTPLCAAAREAMLPHLDGIFGNPSSIHQAGREARAAIDLARDQLARLLGAKSHEIIFTGGGTESDNLGIIGLARSRAAAGKHLITCATEHHAVLHAFDLLEKREGFRVTRLPVNAGGRIDLQQLADAFTPETTLVSLMSANNETGTRQPVCEVSALCRERGVLFHCDGIQSFGKESLRGPDFDALTLAAHKFYGPKGAGLLYLKAGLPIERLQVGGSHEGERRAGTENAGAIAGMAAAAHYALGGMEAEGERQAWLRDELWQGVQRAYPTAVRNGSPEHALPNTLNVTFPGLEGESLLMNLDLEGVCVSSGSACMVGSVLPSHVLLAMGVPAEQAKSTVRFSLGRATTAEEIAQTIVAVERTVLRMHRKAA
jgi:cysteine desulfurase